MPLRAWLLIAALGVGFPALGQAQEPAEPIPPAQPQAESGQEEGRADANESASGDEAAEPEIVSAIQGVEAAVRDLVAEENEIESQRQRDQENRDLHAQESMAWWALWMFVATVASVLVTAAGLFLIWRTLHYTREAAQHTKDMLDEAKKATVAAYATVREAEKSTLASEAAVAVARNANVIDQRAWLAFEDVRIAYLAVAPHQLGENQLGLKVEVSLRVVNLGKTPAQDVGLSFAAFPSGTVIWASAIKQLQADSDDEAGRGWSIPPNASWSTTIHHIMDFNAPADTDFALLDIQAVLFARYVTIGDTASKLTATSCSIRTAVRDNWREPKITPVKISYIPQADTFHYINTAGVEIEIHFTDMT